MPFIYLRRRVSFSSAHAYYLPDKTAEENVALFGRWASKWGHGHNYVAEVTVAGNIDPQDGMVVNITDVDKVLKRQVIEELADKHLTYEVPYFANVVPTTENIARYIADGFNAQWTNPHAKLTRVILWEMPTLWATVDLEKNMVCLTRAMDFAAAHRLNAESLTDAENRDIFGKCNNPAGHGHNYGVEITVAGQPDPVTGMLVDLSVLDAVIEREVNAHFDHKHLNYDVAEFAHVNPTSENLTKVIWDRLVDNIPNPARLYRVVVRETERNWFEYYGGAVSPK